MLKLLCRKVEAIKIGAPKMKDGREEGKVEVEGGKKVWHESI